MRRSKRCRWQNSIRPEGPWQSSLVRGRWQVTGTSTAVGERLWAERGEDRRG